MEKETIKVQAESAGKRLDVFLADKLKLRFSRNQIKHLIEQEKVTVNLKTKKPHYILMGTEDIEVILPDIEEPKILAEDLPIDIVYEDDDIIIVNKQSDIVVHPAAGNPEHTLVNALLFHAKGKLAHVDTSTRPGIVHRLDKEVSGLMVVAKNDYVYKKLVDGFKFKKIKRRYIAFVKGSFASGAGRADLPIGRATRDRKKMAVQFRNSKEAVTNYKVLKTFDKYTKLSLELETGRTHQIRVHMSYLGHPIVGDTKYGGPKYKRIALYAAELLLEHPRTGKDLHFQIEMPEELRNLDQSKTC